MDAMFTQAMEEEIKRRFPAKLRMEIFMFLYGLQKDTIQNPTRVFAAKMKEGGYEGIPEDMVAAEAKEASALADLWDGKAELDMFSIVMNALEEIDIKKVLKKLYLDYKNGKFDTIIEKEESSYITEEDV